MVFSVSYSNLNFNLYLLAHFFLHKNLQTDLYYLAVPGSLKSLKQAYGSWQKGETVQQTAEGVTRIVSPSEGSEGTPVSQEGLPSSESSGSLSQYDKNQFRKEKFKRAARDQDEDDDVQEVW